MARRFQNPALSVDGVWVQGGRILLVRRGQEPFRGKLALPGGFVEYRETVEEAIVRELEEETGLRVRPVRLLGVYSGPDRDPRHPTTTIVFQVRGRLRTPRGGDDAASAAWYPLAAARGLAFDHDQIVHDALRQLRGRSRGSRTR